MNKSYRNEFLLMFVSAVLCVALVSGLRIIAQQTSQSGKIIYVGPPPAPFRTIQEAINHENTTNGDTIEVDPQGSPYYEYVNVTKSLNISRYSYSLVLPEVRGGFRVTATGVIISQFDIKYRYGIYSGIFVSSKDCVLQGNRITENYNGIHLQYATNCTLVGNVLTNNTYNFGVDGSLLSHFLHSIDTTNKINEKPIQYITNKSNLIIDSTSVGYVGVVNSENITVRNLSLQNNTQGVLLAYTNSSTIQNITALSNEKGICLCNTTDSMIRNITASNNAEGICIFNSRGNTVEENSVSQLSGCGIVIESNSRDNIICNNTIHGNSDGIDIQNSDNNIVCHNTISYSEAVSGIKMSYSDGNIISENYLLCTNRIGYSYTWGIDLTHSSNNIFCGNTIIDNQHGIYLWGSCSGNNFFFNNVYNSTVVQAYSNQSQTTWELNGLEGNYWSDYKGVDKDNDGIGDTPYPIYDYTNNDTRPLMKPWNSTRIHEHPDLYWPYDNTVTTVSNSTVGNFTPNKEEKAILINITSGAGGFCEVTILRLRLDGPFKLFLDGQEIYNYVTSQNETYYIPYQNDTHSIFYINFNASVHHIKIIGTEFGEYGLALKGDVNEDGKVDGKDIAVVSKYYGLRIKVP